MPDAIVEWKELLPVWSRLVVNPSPLQLLIPQISAEDRKSRNRGGLNSCISVDGILRLGSIFPFYGAAIFIGTNVMQLDHLRE
jgi:hypothetical protein